MNGIRGVLGGSLMGVAVCALSAFPLEAQEGAVSLELGAARTFPPSGSDAPQANYGIGGLRLEYTGLRGSGAWITLRRGRALESVGSDWWSAGAEVHGWRRVHARFSLGIAAEGYGFSVAAPYRYASVSGTVRPALRADIGGVQVILSGQGGLGRSVIEVERTDVDRLVRNGLDRAPGTDAVRRAEQDLWHYGGGPEVRWLRGPTLWSAGAGVYASPRGTYSHARAGVGGVWGGTVWQVTTSAWRAPHDTQLSGGIAVQIPIGRRLFTYASGMRTEPDPLIGTRATNQGGALLRWAAIRFGGRASVYTLSARSDGSAEAVFRISKKDADTVQLLGDFTFWEPVTMTRRDGAWETTLPVRPGVYHYGFLVDGEWYLPNDGVSGRIADEWGRENGTLVVPEEQS